MKVVLYGASGMIGSRIRRELLSRGHQVTAVVRDTSKLNGANVTAGKATCSIRPALPKPQKAPMLR